MAELKHEDLKNLDPNQVVDALATGATIVNASLPFLKEIFGKIKELVQSIQTDKLSTPRGKRMAIEELQRQVEILIAKDAAQKELNKIYDAYFEALKQKGIL